MKSRKLIFLASMILATATFSGCRWDDSMYTAFVDKTNGNVTKCDEMQYIEMLDNNNNLVRCYANDSDKDNDSNCGDIDNYYYCETTEMDSICKEYKDAFTYKLCPEGYVCEENACRIKTKCAEGTISCPGNICIDPNNVDYCGATGCGEKEKGTPCQGKQVCTDGKCVCPNGFYFCNGDCHHPAEPDYCGIQADCKTDETYDKGCKSEADGEKYMCQLNSDRYSCLLSGCGNNSILCSDDNGKNRCIQKSDLNNCGYCGLRCEDQSRSNSSSNQCKQVHNDNVDENLNIITYACSYQCNDGLNNCNCKELGCVGNEFNPICVDTNTNASHCGKCNNKCIDNQQCKDGRCVETTCQPNECDFQGDCVNEDIACGRSCLNCKKNGQTCKDGVCTKKCETGEHKIYDDDKNEFCVPNTPGACAPKNNASNDDVVDCTRMNSEEEHIEEMYCNNNGRCAIKKCESNYVLDGEKCVACTGKFNNGTCTPCYSNEHVSQERNACIKNTSIACGAPSWDGSGEYRDYAKSCESLDCIAPNKCNKNDCVNAQCCAIGDFDDVGAVRTKLSGKTPTVSCCANYLLYKYSHGENCPSDYHYGCFKPDDVLKLEDSTCWFRYCRDNENVCDNIQGGTYKCRQESGQSNTNSTCATESCNDGYMLHNSKCYVKPDRCGGKEGEACLYKSKTDNGADVNTVGVCKNSQCVLDCTHLTSENLCKACFWLQTKPCLNEKNEVLSCNHGGNNHCDGPAPN